MGDKDSTFSQELPNSAPDTSCNSTRFAKTRWFIFCSMLAIGVYVLWFNRSPVGGFQKRLPGIKTAQQELELFRDIQAGSKSYEVICLDASGKSIALSTSKWWDQVSSVRVEWSAGKGFDWKVIQPTNLLILTQDY